MFQPTCSSHILIIIERKLVVTDYFVEKEPCIKTPTGMTNIKLIIIILKIKVVFDWKN
jgi:hypothetical protein